MDAYIGDGPLEMDTKCEIISCAFSRRTTVNDYQQEEHRHDQSFFDHYEEFCNLALCGRYGKVLSKYRHSDILHTVEELKTNVLGTIIKDNLLSTLPCGCGIHPQDCYEAIDCFLALVLRIWLMCKIGTVGDELRSDQKIISWHHGSLRESLTSHFSRQSKLNETVKLEKSFQLRNLERLGGIEVLWTQNLLDHLRVHEPSNEENPFRVSVFYDGRLLEYHQDSGIFPEGLIGETIRTLALLLPQYDADSQDWYIKQCSTNRLDPMASHFNQLDPEERTIEAFTYWRDRLTILKQTYDESEPKNVTQWWSDRRRRVQWATFWIAALVLALTIVFGIIQSIEGALQVYKAYHPA